MKIPITRPLWQALRVLVRAAGRPVAAADMVPAYQVRKPLRAGVVTAMLRCGLIETVASGGGGPLDATYRITPAGQEAAEYGEYEGLVDHLLLSRVTAHG